MRRLLGVVLVVLVAAFAVPSAHAEGAYSPPVDEPIVDHFRPPPTPYAAGNRGIDYGTSPGEEVRAAGDGEVVFAGQVGGSLHVVLLHDGGLRTSYSFLADVAVRRGQRVRRGEVVGHAGAELHFGVRAGDRYLDPEPLLAGRPPDVHLIPVVDRKPGSLLSEITGLVAGLAGHAVRATAAGVVFAAGTAADAVQVVATDAQVMIEVAGTMVLLPVDEWRRYRRGALFAASQRGCTPAGSAPPERPGAGRLLVLVGGLGSAAGQASVLDVDAAGLGYADDAVAQFSYRGGQTSWGHGLTGVHTTSYTADDSVADIRPVVERFRAFLDEIGRAHPGVPVDIVAHSQGGVIARAALEAPGPASPEVDHLVTLGSPHHGAVLADGAVGLRRTGAGRVAAAALDGSPAHAASPAVAELAEGSGFIGGLNAGALPGTVRFTSIGASGDLVVPALQTPVAGATNVVVTLHGLHAHDQLPGSAAAARELQLALGDRPPTCHGISADVAESEAIAAAEHATGAGATLAGASVDLAVHVPGG